MDKILEISRQILALYELWKNYDEKKEISGILEKMPKPKTTPSSPPDVAAQQQGNQPNVV